MDVRLKGASPLRTRFSSGTHFDDATVLRQPVELVRPSPHHPHGAPVRIRRYRRHGFHSPPDAQVDVRSHPPATCRFRSGALTRWIAGHEWSIRSRRIRDGAPTGGFGKMIPLNESAFSSMSAVSCSICAAVGIHTSPRALLRSARPPISTKGAEPASGQNGVR
jgi:hypothetical protein